MILSWCSRLINVNTLPLSQPRDTWTMALKVPAGRWLATRLLQNLHSHNHTPLLRHLCRAGGSPVALPSHLWWLWTGPPTHTTGRTLLWIGLGEPGGQCLACQGQDRDHTEAKPTNLSSSPRQLRGCFEKHRNRWLNTQMPWIYY